MVYFFLGCALLVALLLLGRLIVRANPTQLAGTLRKVGAVALFGVAGFLALRGAMPLAIPLAAFALSLVAGGGIGVAIAGRGRRYRCRLVGWLWLDKLLFRHIQPLFQSLDARFILGFECIQFGPHRGYIIVRCCGLCQQ